MKALNLPILFALVLTYPEFIESPYIKNVFLNNSHLFYCYVYENTSFIYFSMGTPFPIDFLQNFYKKDNEYSYFFEFMINHIILKRLSIFSNIVLLGHSRGAETAQMLGQLPG